MATTWAEGISRDEEKRLHLRRHRLLLLPLPIQGHLNPMFQLGELLYSQGFSITVIRTFFNLNATADHHPHFQIAPLPVSLPEGVSTDDPPSFILTLNAALAVPLVGKLQTLLPSSAEEEDDEEVVVCMISDSMMFAAVEVAEEVGLPNFALRTGSAACCRIYSAVPTMWEKGYLSPSQDLQNEAPLEELPPFLYEDLPFVSTFGKANTYQVMKRMVEHIRSSRGLIINTFLDLEPVEISKIREEDLNPLPIFPIGPLHKLSPNAQSSLLPQDHTCVDWFHTQAFPPRSLLYVSFGSTTRMSKSDLVEIAWGLANSRQPFLWVLRPGSIDGYQEGEVVETLLPEGFLEETKERGKIVRWVNQQEVLRHPCVGGFWTHCGWNSTLEGVCEGVPMLCWPYYADQMVNKRVVEDVWKVGIGVGKVLEREEVERKVRRLMVEEEGGDILRRRAMDFKAKATLCISKGKEGDESSSSWFQLDKLVKFVLLLSKN